MSVVWRMKESEFGDYLRQWSKVIFLCNEIKPSWCWRIESVIQYGMEVNYLEILIEEDINMENEEEDNFVDPSCALDDETSQSPRRRITKSKIHILLHPNYQIPCPYLLSQSYDNYSHSPWIIDEHPLLGIPALTIHPCGLEERVSLLSQPSEKSEELYLLRWFGLIGPLFGLHITLKFFNQASSILQSSLESEN